MDGRWDGQVYDPHIAMLRERPRRWRAGWLDQFLFYLQLHDGWKYSVVLNDSCWKDNPNFLVNISSRLATVAVLSFCCKPARISHLQWHQKKSFHWTFQRCIFLWKDVRICSEVFYSGIKASLSLSPSRSLSSLTTELRSGSAPQATSKRIGLMCN